MLLSILCQIRNINGIGNFKTSFNYDVFLRPQDITLTPIYCCIIIFLAVLYSQQVYHDKPYKKYFLPGLLVKIFGAICVGLIYQFYYGGAGDTAIYYGDGKLIGDLFTTDRASFIKVLFTEGGNTDPENILRTVGFIQYFHDTSAFYVDKIVAIIGLFTFQTYSVIAVVMATLSFSGAWCLYLTLYKIYPNLYKQFALAVFFIPSVFFWGSGILKDCVTFGCLGWFTYAAYNIFFIRKKMIWSIILFVFSGYVIYKVKPYIILSFFPSLLFWVFLTYRSRITSPFVRNLVTPIIILGAAIGGYSIASRLGQEVSTITSFNGFVKKANTFQTWHTYLADNAGASGYTLGTIDPTPLGALAKFPAAVNVTLFRPYLWESHNPVVFLAAIESLVVLIFTIRIFLRTGIVRTIRIIVKNPTVTFCIFFSMLFAFAVGFTAYNFGALVRYKIPCIPFYVSALFILNYITQIEKNTKRNGLLKTISIKAHNLPLQET